MSMDFEVPEATGRVPSASPAAAALPPGVEADDLDLTAPIRGFTITRVIAAPPQQVFDAWTIPAQLGWFGSTSVAEHADLPRVDLRVGGAWRQFVQVDDAANYVTGGIYIDIVPPDKLEFVWGAAAGWPAIGDDIVVKVTLESRQAEDPTPRPTPPGTALTLQLALPEKFSNAETRGWLESGIYADWSQLLDRLVAQFANSRAASS